MKIKSFHADTLREALDLVKKELGPNALILSSGPTKKKSGAGLVQTVYEVTAALDDNPDPTSDVSVTAAQESSTAPGARRLSMRRPAPETIIDRTESFAEQVRQTELEEIRRLLHFIARPSVAAAGSFPDSVSCELYHDLVAQDINDRLAYQLVELARNRITGQGKETKALMAGAVKSLLAKMISVSHLDQETASATRPGTRTVAAFIGPTGVGKTTTVAKLAARHALDKKRKVLLVTVDTYRIAAVEQLKVYAGIIGVPIEIAATVGDLDRILAENFKKDLILIDTIGCSQKDVARMSELAEYLQTATEIEKHLVLSATTKSIDLQEIIDRFSLFGLTNLLFTKLDETATLGPILNELVRTRKPLSYFTNGQRVPEDLRVPTPQDVVDLVMSAN